MADTERGLRTFRVDRIQEATPTGAAVVRPPGFDLAEAWTLITGKVDQMRAALHARALVHQEVLAWCRWTFGTRLQIGPPAADGRVEVEVRGHHLGSLAAELAGFGGRIEVLEPPELRRELAELGAGLVATYRAPVPREPQSA
ncbi:MAG: helix-turn-helix transcriptional regulator [Acidimicrobiales bacterium]